MKIPSQLAFISFIAGIAALTALGVAGCGHATEAQAPRTPISVSPDHPEYLVQTFEAKDVVFSESQLFLWKKDMAPEQVARVLTQASLFDEAKDQLFIMGKRRQELRAKFNGIGVDVVELAEQLAELDAKKADLAETLKQLEGENRKPEAERDAKLIARLSKKKDRLEGQIKPIEATRQKVFTAGAGAELTEWSVLEAKLTERRAQASDYLAPIDATVWIFNSSPISFEFKFPKSVCKPDATRVNHGPRVTQPRTTTPRSAPAPRSAPCQVSSDHIIAQIRNWDMSRINDSEVSSASSPESKDFSTEDGSIDKVTYQEKGGIFAFEVYAPGSKYVPGTTFVPDAVYYFKVARVNYGAIDGRIHYKGDIVRCSVEAGDGVPVIEYVRDFVKCGVQGEGVPVLRRGAATLADQDIKD